MFRFPMPLRALLFTAAILAAPALYAMGSESPAAAIDPDYTAGKKAIAAKDWARAIEALTKAAQRDAGNADIQNFLGYAYRNSGRLELALKHYEAALSLDPKHRGAREYLGELYLMQNNLAKAEEQRAALDGLCFFPCEELTELREKIVAYKKNAK
ncbi:MAG: tetratricopeptide repeat protein [Burkholderiales bacterium]